MSSRLTEPAEQLKADRIERGLSMTKAAALAGMSWDTWSRLEKGDPTVQVAYWQKAASVLDLEVYLELEDLYP